MNNCPWCNRKLIKDARGIRCSEGFCNYSIVVGIEIGDKKKMDGKEISEMWINGNRKDMIKELREIPPLEVAVIMLDMGDYLSDVQMEKMSHFISNQL